MEKKELIELGRKIINCEGAEEEIDAMVTVFNQNVPHPEGASLFFYPEKYNARHDTIEDYNPTVEEVVNLVLNYKPIVLPPLSDDI